MRLCCRLPLDSGVCDLLSVRDEMSSANNLLSDISTITLGTDLSSSSASSTSVIPAVPPVCNLDTADRVLLSPSDQCPSTPELAALSETQWNSLSPISDESTLTDRHISEVICSNLLNWSSPTTSTPGSTHRTKKISKIRVGLGPIDKFVKSKRPFDADNHPNDTPKKLRGEDSMMANEKEAGLAELIKSMESNLNKRLDGISQDIQVVRSDAKKDFIELKQFYTSLEDKITEIEINTGNRLAKFEDRLACLENGSSGGALSEDWINNRVDALVRNALSAYENSRANKLEELEASLALNLNNTLVKLDAKERELRKLNVIIRGLPNEQSNSSENVKKFLQDKFNLGEEITAVKSVGVSQWPVVTFANWDTKLSVLKKKREVLRNTNIYIDADLTPREESIMNKLRGIARGERSKGAKVQVKHLKICMRGHWLAWDEVRQKLTPTTLITRKSVPVRPNILEAGQGNGRGGAMMQ